jgi:oligosaccharide repeat unit polymerase
MIFLAIGILVIWLCTWRARADTLILRLWCVVWGVSAIACAPLDTRSVVDISSAYVYLAVLTLMLAAGGAMGRLRGAHHRSPVATGYVDRWAHVCSKRRHLLTTVLLIGISFLSVRLLLNDLGKGIQIVWSLEEIAIAAAATSIERYSNDFEPSSITRIASTSMFLSALFAGWYWRRDQTWARVAVAVSASLPALLWTVILTTKASLLFWLIFYFSAYLAFRAPKFETTARRPAVRNAMRTRLTWIAGAVALVGFMFLVQLSRYGGDLDSQGEDVIRGLTVASVGHIYAFRDWFERAASWLPVSFGGRTFAGIFELVGLGVREAGLYRDDLVFVADSSTNVYSAIRGVTEDFGTAWTMAVFFIIGFVSGRIQTGSPTSAGNRAWLTTLAIWIIWSPIVSAYNYNSLVMACGVFILFSFQRARRTHVSPSPQPSTRIRQLPVR